MQSLSLVAGMIEAENATAESYAEALLPLSQNVFVLEEALGLDTDAVQVLGGSSSAHGLGPTAVALPFAHRLGPSPLPCLAVLQRARTLDP